MCVAIQIFCRTHLTIYYIPFIISNHMVCLERFACLVLIREYCSTVVAYLRLENAEEETINQRKSF